MEVSINSMNQMVHYNRTIYEEDILVDSNLMNNEILNECLLKLNFIQFNIMQFDTDKLRREDFINLQNLEIQSIISSINRLKNINFQTRMRLNESVPIQKYVTLI